MRIALDFDDVCTDTEEFGVQAYQELAGLSGFEYASRTTLVNTGLITLDEYRTYQEQIYCDLDRAKEKLRFKEGFIEHVARLQEGGHTVGIVTARSGTALEIAQYLLSTQGLNLPFVGVGYGNSKAEALKEYDVFIDDDPKNLMDVVDTGIKLFIMTTKENKEFSHPDIIRVSSWAEFYELVSSIES